MKITVIKATQSVSFLLFTAFVNPLMAQTTTDYSEGWYMGGNMGISTANIDKDKITQNFINPSYNDDEQDLGYKLFGGYQFNKNFALEGGYFNLGKFDYSLSTPNGTLNGDIKVMGINLDAVAILPITEAFSAFARIGANYAQAKDSFATTGTISILDNSPKENDLNYKFGAGLQYAVTKALALRLEAERYRINDAVGNDGDIDFFSIGLIYKFGVKTEVIPVVEKEKVIAIISKKEEILIIVTAIDAEEKIRESVIQDKTVVLVFEDIHFEFDKSTLNKEAKDALKKVIFQLKENPKITMHIAGYTSESGTQIYNQGLSERRAQAVKDYLVQENLFPVDKISVIGYGETKPAIYEVDPSNINSKAAKANMRVLLEIIQQ
jgi:OmpA-OmpF porin, OOP family